MHVTKTKISKPTPVWKKKTYDTNKEKNYPEGIENLESLYKLIIVGSPEISSSTQFYILFLNYMITLCDRIEWFKSINNNL
jgi:hypothetical protein